MLRYKRHVQSFTEAEIAEKLKVAETLRGEGKRIYEIARVLGVTDTTYYNWLKRAEQPAPGAPGRGLYAFQIMSATVLPAGMNGSTCSV